MSSDLEGVTIHHIETSATTPSNGSTDDQEQTLDEQVAPVVEGYPKLAQLMRRYPPTAIFRSFTELSLINLLRMQSELHRLEQRLEIARESDAKKDDRKYSSCSFYQMRENGSKQKELLEEIDLKLERYEDALLRMTKLRKVQKPSKEFLNALQLWLTAPDGGQNFLMAPEHTIWNPSLFEHICLSKSEQKDIFYELMCSIFLRLYHNFWRRYTQKGPSVVTESDDSLVEALAGLLSILASSLLPTLAILLLCFVKPPLVRIALVCIITGLISFLLSWLTKTRRMEIFSATAAFAAVMIVFVSNGAPNNGS